jgi:hypothetical protein
MSGWDNAPEYGGGGHWFTNALLAGLIAAFIAALLWLGFQPQASAAGKNPAELAGVL